MWEKFADPIDRVSGYLCKYGSQPGKGFNTVHFASAEQAVQHATSFSSFMRTGEEIVFPAKCYRTYAVLDGIVVDVEHSVFSVSAQAIPSFNTICKCFADRTFGYSC